MGKHHFGKNKRNRESSSTDQSSTTSTDQKPYNAMRSDEKTNENFIAYYSSCNPLTANKEEWETFLSSAQSPLPTTFRITGSRSHAIQLRDQMKTQFFSAISQANLAAPQPLCWYPDALGWQLEGGRSEIRSNEAYSLFHRFLINETEIGNVTRQEAVSMIPPLLLDVQPGHAVLDMCAAPGSKTTQILEALHCKDDDASSGLVIANDADNKRCYTLVHQAKRLQSPALMVTNHDATIFPKIFLSNLQDGTKEPLRFDRVLADVPCSGDGTMRKNLLVWKEWNPMQANGLHSVQLKVLERGIQLAKEGGRIVYSTCSLNPVENEAVVSAILSKFDGALELEDVSALLPGLVRIGGMQSWKVMDRQGNCYASFDEIPQQFRDKFKESMFPCADAAVIEKQHLERCVRIHPHFQNTGGFFVAVFKKTGPTSNADRNAQTVVEKFSGFREKPFMLLVNDDGASNEETQAIHRFYGVDSAAFPANQYFVRSNEGKNRTIYHCSSLVSRILAGQNDSLKIVNTGIKAFSRNESSATNVTCFFRMHFEFVKCVIGSMSDDRIVRIGIKDLKICLQEEFPARALFSTECQKRLDETVAGCVVFSVRERKAGSDYAVELSFSAWIGKSTATVYLVPEEKRSILERVSFYENCDSSIENK